MASPLKEHAMKASRIDAVNILLVDDQPSKLLTYESILEELNENLITASSATQALECLLKNEIAVVLVDVCMPEFDGYELAVMIRQHPRFQKTSIIFVSAIMMTDLDRLRGYECGGVDYVPVPVVPEILRAKVSIFAELYRKTRALELLNRELEERVADRTAALEAGTAALQEADRRKDEFLAMLSHELRNPLAPIRTAVQLLRLKELGAPQRIHALEVIERQTEHLVRLIDDLLDVSRITRGMIVLHREPVLIGAIVARAVETSRPAIDARRHELILELSDEVITVEGDKTRLVQVVANILHNAAKFTDDGGRIVLTVTRQGPSAVISVKDSGIGLPQGSVARIFELFSQVHKNPDRAPSGLGIGLALVRRLVEMHGGTVTASSEGIGRGAEFTVRLPLAGQETSRVAGKVLDPPRLPAFEGRRMLVADDNHDAAEALAELLELGGHEVRIAHNGIDALAVAESFMPDVILLDLGMPKMDGYETARQIRRHEWGKRATLMALTGWGQQQDRQRTAAVGFDVHLVKPVTDLDVLQALEAANWARKVKAASGI
ncbi:MAG: hybrid sensor histidine kinase/response regulator [Acidobacteria bacterium]|nr:MAG: hybrid sensor histidine kinase/response regulator [Acidobacteriota bacterium]